MWLGVHGRDEQYTNSSDFFIVTQKRQSLGCDVICEVSLLDCGLCAATQWKNWFTGNPATNDLINCHAAATDVTVYVLLTEYWHSLPLSFLFFYHLVFMFVNFLRITLMFVPLFFLCWTLAFFYYSWALNFTVGLYFKLPAAFRFIKLWCTAFWCVQCAKCYFSSNFT